MLWEPDPEDEGVEGEVCSDPSGTLAVEFRLVGTAEPRVPVDTEPDVDDGEDPGILPPVTVLFPEIDVPLCSKVRN